MHKKKLSNDEKEIVLNYFNIKKDFESSPKHRRNNNNLKSHISKRKNKNSFSKFKNAANEDKTDKEKIENEENNNIILKEFKNESNKISWLKTVFCCLEN